MSKRHYFPDTKPLDTELGSSGRCGFETLEQLRAYIDVTSDRFAKLKPTMTKARRGQLWRVLNELKQEAKAWALELEPPPALPARPRAARSAKELRQHVNEGARSSVVHLLDPLRVPHLSCGARSGRSTTTRAKVTCKNCQHAAGIGRAAAAARPVLANPPASRARRLQLLAKTAIAAAKKAPGARRRRRPRGHSLGELAPEEVRHGRVSGCSITYELRAVLCGKPRCRKLHGPYWYAYWRAGGRTRSAYVGRVFRELEAGRDGPTKPKKGAEDVRAIRKR